MPVFAGEDAAAIERAAERWAAGELVAFPTETVYGLGARADDDRAVARIYAAKGRPADHPLIVHVQDIDAARRHAAHWPDAADRLARACWPGPLTLIVRRAPGVAEAAAGGHPTIGLRSPAHPVARALLAAAAARGVPGVAAPSANRYGRVSPTSAAHVVAELGPDLWVLDGGRCEVGIESTIVDCSGAQPRLLRPGTMARAEIEALLQQPLADAGAEAPRAPGMLASHYAPRARVRLLESAELQRALSQMPGTGPAAGIAVYSRQAATPAVPHNLSWKPMPSDPRTAAQRLYADLRELDDLGVAAIWIEAVPQDPAWDGVRDRLQRAATMAN